MLIVDDPSRVPKKMSYPVFTIGVFDGVHRGHQAILGRLLSLAREKGGASVVLTFDPHPQQVITPGTAPVLLQTSRQKEDLLKRMGVAVLLRLPFSREMSLLSPERFVNDILLAMDVREIVLGANFRFGHKRSGDFSTLQALCAPRQIPVQGVEPITLRGVRISSTRIRAFLTSGHVEAARRMLNRPYQLSGKVARGDGAGAGLGFPTANLEPENQLIPASGVYAGRALVAGETRTCVINIGVRPTLHPEGESRQAVIEAHLLDFEADLYDTAIALDFCVRLRGERRFESVDALKAQIAKDIAITRQYAKRVGA